MWRYMFILIFLVFIFGCGGSKISQEDLNRIDVVIVTELGEIGIDLFDETPKHRDNFLKLAREDFYDSVAFHRIIDEFVIQAGDPRTRESYPGVDPKKDNGPGYQLPAEIGSYSVHIPGRLAAARQPDSLNSEKRSAGSQFYIVAESDPIPNRVIDSMENVRTGQIRGRIYEAYQKAIHDGRYEGDFESYQSSLGFEEFSYPVAERQAYREKGGAISLDFSYTVFGEVVSGMDVVKTISLTATDQYDRPRKAIRILDVRIPTQE